MDFAGNRLAICGTNKEYSFLHIDGHMVHRTEPLNAADVHKLPMAVIQHKHYEPVLLPIDHVWMDSDRRILDNLNTSDSNGFLS